MKYLEFSGISISTVFPEKEITLEADPSDKEKKQKDKTL